MPMRRPVLILPLTLAVLACPGSARRRGREALTLVADLHRDIVSGRRKAAQEFARRPGAAEDLAASHWPGCPLADSEGLRASRSLLKGYLDLQAAPEGEARVAGARLYVAALVGNSEAGAAALRREAGADPASPRARVDEAAAALAESEAARARRCLAKLEALAGGGAPGS